MDGGGTGGGGTDGGNRPDAPGGQTDGDDANTDDTSPVIIGDSGADESTDSDEGGAGEMIIAGNDNRDGTGRQNPASEEEELNPLRSDDQLADMGFNQLTNPNASDEMLRVIEESGRYGVGSIFISKPREVSLDVAVALEFELGIETRAMSFPQALRRLSMLSMIPIQLDTSTLQAHGIDFHFDAKLDGQLASVSKILDQLVAERRMQWLAQPWGVLITAQDHEVLVEREYEIFEFDSEPEKSYEAIENFIRRHFGRGTWVVAEEGGMSTLERQGRKFLIQQTPAWHQTIGEFFDKMNRAHAMVSGEDPARGPDSGEADADEFFLSQSAAASELLGQDSQLHQPVAQPMLELFSQVERETGLCILVDWRSVLADGWNANALIPWAGNQPLQKTLQDIVFAMDLEYTVIDSTTVELTTRQAAQNQLQLEVFPCHRIVKTGKLKLLEDLLGYSVGRRYNPQAGMFFDYESESKCILAILPQDLQRKLELAWEFVDEQANGD